MEKSTAQLTEDYIKENPYIKNCLKKGLINYSSLSRLIAKELKIEKKSSKEAILVAARRFYEKIKKDICHEKKITKLLSESEFEVKNKITVFILSKDINLNLLEDIRKSIRKDFGVFYLLEGSHSYTLIIQEKNAKIIEKIFKNKIIKNNLDLVLFIVKSHTDIEKIQGVLSYMTSLFAENGVNIVEFLSSWTDTLFVINKRDLNKVINFLNF